MSPAAAAGLTDVGRRRDINEDAFVVDEGIGLYAVADGMGGHAAGEVASRLAVEALAKALRDEAERRGPPPAPGDAARRLRAAVASANRDICAAVVSNDEQRGMGTTLVALLRLQNRVLVGHVGDSRAYMLRGGVLVRLTSDHSWVNEQVKLGVMSDDAAQRHPMRNIVTRALGSRSDVPVDVAEHTIRPGDVVLLCSDGLNTMLDDDEIRDTLQRAGRDPAAACRLLVEAANARGGEDNVTVIVIRVD
jgi:PPM family protein phosphatase